MIIVQCVTSSCICIVSNNSLFVVRNRVSLSLCYLFA